MFASLTGKLDFHKESNVAKFTADNSASPLVEAAKKGILFCSHHPGMWISKPGMMMGVTTRDCPLCIQQEKQQQQQQQQQRRSSSIGSYHDTTANYHSHPHHPHSHPHHSVTNRVETARFSKISTLYKKATKTCRLHINCSTMYVPVFFNSLRVPI